MIQPGNFFFDLQQPSCSYLVLHLNKNAARLSGAVVASAAPASSLSISPGWQCTSGMDEVYALLLQFSQPSHPVSTPCSSWQSITAREKCSLTCISQPTPPRSHWQCHKSYHMLFVSLVFPSPLMWRRPHVAPENAELSHKILWYSESAFM